VKPVRQACPGCPWPQSARDDGAVDPIAIADEVVRSLIPRKGLRDLTGNPFCRRICCELIQTSSLRSSRTMTKA
jgi:hypothetical protein